MIYRVLLVAVFVVLSACNTHLVGRTDSPLTSQIGISVPVPPPSLCAAPIQLVEVEGKLDTDAPVPDTRVFLFDQVSGRGYFVVASDSGEFVFTDVKLDLSNNCLEVWSEEPGAEGQASERSFYVADIADDDASVVTMELADGC